LRFYWDSYSHNKLFQQYFGLYMSRSPVDAQVLLATNHNTLPKLSPMNATSREPVDTVAKIPAEVP
jgi:hypothetical protein